MSPVHEPAPEETGRPTAQPFDEEPRDLAPPGKGCSKMALGGCAVVLLLVGLGVLALMLKARDVVAWSLERVRTEVVRSLPEDLPTAERERLERAFEAVLATLESGELDAMAFRDLQRQMRHFAGLRRAPSRGEVQRLTEALERFAGIAAEPVDEPELPGGRADEGG